LDRGLALLPAEKAVLILSTPLSPITLQQLNLKENFQIWDGYKLSRMLEAYPAVRNAYSAALSAQQEFKRIIDQSKPPDEANRQAQELITRLDAVPRGKDGWREYEDVCIDIFNYAFMPPLRPPRIQNWTEDGLDRRDAIYPIGTGGAFWESIKYEHSSRMVVVEFKNYTGPIGQTEVESLGQYLLPKAKRSFGILCSREPPSEPAVKARRRAWMTAENIILFLSDGDLAQMAQIRAEDGDPAEILDAQMDEFFIKLAP
jgi:hypothetical protein